MAETAAEIRGALRSCALLRAASDAAIERLAGVASVESVRRGTLLASEGDAADRFGVVVAGKVRVFHLGADGRRIIFETLGAGEAFAVTAALAGGRHPATIETTTNATVAWVHRESLYELLPRESGVARGLIADLASSVVGLTTVIRTLALDVPGRLAHYLFQRSLEVGEATPEGLRVTLGMSKTDLAASLGTVPETLSRAFARLRDDGVLTVRGADVIVYDVGALARLGSGWDDG